MNKPSELNWKNFQLGTELQISGSFLYNGIYFLDQMENFYLPEESFEVLYNISVGLERLGKIAVILLEHESSLNQKVFEKKLRTHNHISLYNRINKLKPLSFGKYHMKFLTLLTDFYLVSRYDRFGMKSGEHRDQDKYAFVKFIESGLGISISVEPLFPTQNNKKIKNFIGDTLEKITSEYYEIICNRASELNIYTNEMLSDSKAAKIFLSKSFNFESEKLMQGEILVSILNDENWASELSHIKSIKPIDLTGQGVNHYLPFLLNIHKNRGVLDELEFQYEENGFKNERIAEIENIGTDFDEDFSEDEF